MQRTAYLLPVLLSVLLLTGHTVRPQVADFAPFVEPDFPFITTTVDAAPGLPSRNMAVRGIVLQLGNDSYAAFDPDLLRMAVGWRGGFMELTSMAQVSYHEPGNKNNGIPRILGEPLFSTGIYPGWLAPGAPFEDPRPAGPNPEEIGRGPLPVEQGRWNGLYVSGRQAVLSYTVQGTEVYEQPGSVAVNGEVGITRTFRTGPVGRSITLVAAEVDGGSGAQVQGNTAVVFHGAGQDTVTAVGVAGAPAGARLEIIQNRYVTLALPQGTPSSLFKVVVWKGPADRLPSFRRMLEGPIEMVDLAAGGPAHWPGTVATQGRLSAENGALVLDELTLPLPNPWRRNVRVAGIDFFSDGRAALSTFEGDVWLLSGIGAGLRNLTWKRFASGLSETMSLKIVEDEVYVFGREGIVRLNDLNGDGEADYYENFSNLPIQALETREFPLSMGVGPDGSFYVSKGAALDAGPRTSSAVSAGFRAGTSHSGTILRISPDGRALEVYATGLREPFLAVDRRSGIVTTSDQQGNYVPSTPIYVARQGDYLGVPITAHRPTAGEAAPPLLWVPHQVDQSGAGQVWVNSDRMGPLNDALVHLSYGEPAAFRVYIDSSAAPWQGAIIELPVAFRAPAMQGAVRPADGQLYVAGFMVWDSKATQTSALMRLRYTGAPSPLPSDIRAGAEGIILHFDQSLDPAVATLPGRYAVERWNYRRTEAYGSGHFKTDGSPGQETLPVAAARLSRDGKAVLLVVPGMAEVMQMVVRYDVRSTAGLSVQDAVYLTVNRLQPLDLETQGFDPAGVASALAAPVEVSSPTATVVSAGRGREVYLQMGCMACHSIDGTLQGKTGPTFKNAYGTTRTLADGTTIRAGAAYLRRSILEPAAQVVHGFPQEMPSYLGVLSEADIESMILFIRSLSDE